MENKAENIPVISIKRKKLPTWAIFLAVNLVVALIAVLVVYLLIGFPSNKNSQTNNSVNNTSDSVTTTTSPIQTEVIKEKEYGSDWIEYTFSHLLSGNTQKLYAPKDWVKHSFAGNELSNHGEILIGGTYNGYEYSVFQYYPMFDQFGGFSTNEEWINKEYSDLSLEEQNDLVKITGSYQNRTYTVFYNVNVIKDRSTLNYVYLKGARIFFTDEESKPEREFTISQETFNLDEIELFVERFINGLDFTIYPRYFGIDLCDYSSQPGARIVVSVPCSGMKSTGKILPVQGKIKGLFENNLPFELKDRDGAVITSGFLPITAETDETDIFSTYLPFENVIYFETGKNEGILTFYSTSAKTGERENIVEIAVAFK